MINITLGNGNKKMENSHWKKFFFCVFLILSFLFPFASQGSNLSKSEIKFTRARLLSVQEFDKKTKGKFKNFRCKVIGENKKEWIFFFDEYIYPPGPGGSDLTVFVNKKTGEVKSYFGE